MCLYRSTLFVLQSVFCVCVFFHLVVGSLLVHAAECLSRLVFEMMYNCVERKLNYTHSLTCWIAGCIIGLQLVVEVIHHLWWVGCLHVLLQHLLFHDQGLSSSDSFH